MEQELSQEEIKALRLILKKGIIQYHQDPNIQNSCPSEPEERYFKCICDEYNYFKNGVIYSENDKPTEEFALKVSTLVSIQKTQWQEVTKEDYLKQEQDIFRNLIKEEERKPLFTFEGHEYFETTKTFHFSKANYQIYENEADEVEGEQYEDKLASKIYPTEFICKAELYNWIWENHKTTASEMKEIDKQRQEYNRQFGMDITKYISHEDFYCQNIINQKQS